MKKLAKSAVLLTLLLPAAPSQAESFLDSARFHLELGGLRIDGPGIGPEFRRGSKVREIEDGEGGSLRGQWRFTERAYLAAEFQQTRLRYADKQLQQGCQPIHFLLVPVTGFTPACQLDVTEHDPAFATFL